MTNDRWTQLIGLPLPIGYLKANKQWKRALFLLIFFIYFRKAHWHYKYIWDRYFHTGQCKLTGGCYNELVVAFVSTRGGVKGKKNLYLFTLLFIYKLAFILFVMTPGAQTTGNIAVYGSAKQLVI